MNWSKKLYKIFTEYDPSTLINNLHTKFKLYEVDDEAIISTITDEVKPNSYVASPYALIINYSKDELFKIESKVQRAFFSLLIKVFDVFFRFSKIDKVQTLNNYLLATNFFSDKWEELNLKELEQKATEAYPEHTLLFRSVNPTQNPKLFQNLLNNGWIGVVTRQVYLFRDEERWMGKRDSKKDRKLRDSKRFSFVKVEDVEHCDFERIEELYGQVYLKKHSEHNIHYTAEFFPKMVENNLYSLHLLQDNENKKYVGVVALTNDLKVTTLPLLGYDTSYPQKDALYRRLMDFGIGYAFEHGLLLNISSGASTFKLTRGAEAELEYMFVKVDHLPFYRRVVWRGLAYLSEKFYAPMLVRLKL